MAPPAAEAAASPGSASGASTQAPFPLLEVPHDFQDPITHELMWDPVLLVETGHTYSRSSIQQWFQRGNRTCPKTNRKLKTLLVATNWTLRSLIESWAQEHGVPVPGHKPAPMCAPAAGPTSDDGPSPSNASDLHSHPITLGDDGMQTSTSDERRPASEAWTFFQGYDSPDGNLFQLQFDPHSSATPMMQLLEAADKVPNCIAFNSAGHLKTALKPRANWVLCEDSAMTLVGPHPEQAGLYVRTQCLPFIEAGCSSWATDAAAVPESSGWTFFPGMDSPGGDICQALTPADASALSGVPPAALTSAEGSITSSSAIALLALAKPIVVAFNSNGWLKALLQPMHGWVKWTTEAGKGLFVRNDVVIALLSGVLAHVQGNQLAPVQLAGWTFFHGLDSLSGDVHWSWQHANNPAKLAEEACMIDGVIAFNTNGYIKTSLQPRAYWTKVEVWADKPGSGLYVHNSVLWKLLIT